jgi:phosphohistidine phosphatase
MAPREIWLLRHAKSDWGTGVRTDFERPLSRRGREDAPRLGAWMADEGLVPDLVVTSPARRAEETLALVLEGLEAAPPVRRDERIYDAGVGDLLEVLRGLPEEAERVLLVGHNPGLEDLAGWLGRDPIPRTASGKGMTTCNLVRLELAGSWRAVEVGEARLRTWMRPSDL